MYLVFKRILDVCLSIMALLLLVPLFLFLSVLIRLRLGRPVLFKQQRPGLKGKPFTLLKFRTMKNTHNFSGDLASDEQRLTPLGRWIRAWSLDEIPQLINVIKGDLSLVGPRPLLMEYLPLYSPEQARRHDLRPGLTGLAQVKGRNSLSWDEKFRLDIDYIDRVSFLLDTIILLETIKTVFSRKGIHQSGHATMPHFTGNHHDA